MASRHPVLPLDPARFAPTAERPVRAKVRTLDADARVVPHSHPWAQVVFSTAGVVRVEAGRHSYIVPPQRAVWVPAGVEHAVTVVERAELRTLYLRTPRPGGGPPRLRDPGRVHEPVDADVAAAPNGATAANGSADTTTTDGAWARCRVLEVSPLLRELVLQLAAAPGRGAADAREALLAALVCDELAQARPLPLGVGLPADKRLRTLCEAVIDDPTRHATLQAWAAEAGASVRTVARLFRQELGTTFVQWRRQVLLAKALSMAAQRRPMAHIAASLGYASASAFSAMVRRSAGLPPRRLLGVQRVTSPTRPALPADAG